MNQRREATIVIDVVPAATSAAANHIEEASLSAQEGRQGDSRDILLCTYDH